MWRTLDLRTPSSTRVPRTLVLTALAMLAFAANSLLSRMALGEQLIDVATFTSVRVLSGAVMLVLILYLHAGVVRPGAADWRSVAALLVYMVFFSFAYLSLSAGAGALILFGAVQVTMFVVALRQGERFSPISWGGFALAILGLVYLVSPGLTAPDPRGALLMAVSGVAWGAYSLLGRGAADPLQATAGNFVYSVPLVLIVSLVFIGDHHSSTMGLVLAIACGALTSGCGYVVWYAALGGLTAMRASTVQLSVPVIAAIGGALLLSESITLRLLLASVATLGGVAIVLTQKMTPGKLVRGDG